jgi:hypothetical protein
LVGNLNVSGTISSKFCDTVAGSQGEIEELELVVNDAEDAFAIINVSSTKGSNGPVGRAYPYSGSFSSIVSVIPSTMS